MSANEHDGCVIKAELGYSMQNALIRVRMHDDSQIAHLQREVAALQGRIAGLEMRAAVASQATAALQKSEERFAKIFRASPVAVVISTVAEGRYIEVNQRFTDL